MSDSVFYTCYRFFDGHRRTQMTRMFDENGKGVSFHLPLWSATACIRRQTSRSVELATSAS